MKKLLRRLPILLCVIGCSRDRAAARADAPPAKDVASVVAVHTSETRDAAPLGPPKDLNVILISIDSLRADMPWAGYARPIAPRLTAFEKKSVDFAVAYSISSYTSTSLGGLLGGRLPSELLRDGYFFNTYSKDNLFFPELLQAKGIGTYAGQSHGYFKTAGFNQGFDEWEIVPNLKWDNTTDRNITSEPLEAIAEKELSDPAHVKKRFFAWYHFLDPHDQYMPHDKDGIPAYGPKLRDRYDGEVTYTDRYVGRLLDFIAAQSWGARTAIIVTADHGEALGEHQQWSHGFELWQDLVRVPLMFYVPNAPAHHVDLPTSALDLAPTICALFGVAPDARFEGKSLLPEIFDAKGATDAGAARDVAMDLPATSDNGRRRALVHGHMKLISILNDAYLNVYDLDKDPGELTPVHGDAYREMVERYRAFEKTIHDVPSYGCREDCLNGAYLKKKDAGAKAE